MVELIARFAEQRLMIRRTPGEVYESITEFLVAVDDQAEATEAVVGCVGLHVYEPDLAELKCLAVSEARQGRGIGRLLVDGCWEMARSLGVSTVFALTHAPHFFERCGYWSVDKGLFPQKIWSECVRCPAFPHCRETALVRSTQPRWLRLAGVAEVNGTAPGAVGPIGTEHSTD